MAAPANPDASLVLDLHDIVVLLNFERVTTDPRFRHAKLREVTTTHFRTVLHRDLPEWNLKPNRIGWVFDTKKPPASREHEPDLPSNMLPSPTPENLRDLTPQQLETYFWQARNHDGCFASAVLLQYFLDLFPDDTRLRVRTVENGCPKIYETLADSRSIIEFRLYDPKLLTVSDVMPGSTSYIGGGDDTMPHCVLGFKSGDPSHAQSHILGFDTILDMSCLQYGDVGRGFGGRGLFVLESEREYASRLRTFAERNSFHHAKISWRIQNVPPHHAQWLREAAKRAKARWDERHKTRFCGHCGAPLKVPRRCGACRSVWYCDEMHQRSAWPSHKPFCKTLQTSSG